MKVRTQLLIAFLLLAVVPLACIVLYSWVASERAFRHAVAAEAEVLTRETGKRLATLREELERRLEALESLPFGDLRAGTAEKAATVYTDLMIRMGDAADLVDLIEFTPTAVSGDDDGASAPAAMRSRAEPFFIYPSRVLADAIDKLIAQRVRFDDPALSEAYLREAVQQAIKGRALVEADELDALDARKSETERLLGSEFTIAVSSGRRVVGKLKAYVPASRIVRRVLSRTPRGEGEIPYALDSARSLYVESPEDRLRLGELLETDSSTEAASQAANPLWILAETPDPESGLTFGIARPVGDALKGIRQTALRSLAYGLGLVLAALVGVLFLSSRMTQNLDLLTAGAERLADGDLETRVAVRSRSEFGRLAGTFNRMASEISEKQRLLLEEEALRREQEVEKRLLEAENDRKSLELEEAREFQMSLLPKNLPRHPVIDVAVHMRTATEVGGDYYDFFPSSDGVLTTAIGDAAGHGARAGTMVTVVKGLLSVSAEGDLSQTLGSATNAIKRMNLGRMNMALTLLRTNGRRMSISAAGMPPVLHYSVREESLQEIALVGMPLGSMADTEYQLWESDLSAGDTVLLMTDGFPELLNGEQEAIGYDRVRTLFEAHCSKDPVDLVASLAAEAVAWTEGRPPQDDITFVVLRVRQQS